eukprot:m.1094150 g.1094150  ORF g.1094150 m.1094150 type:complete len:360 (+) comp24300_c0_seq8:324-1403(+)
MFRVVSLCAHVLVVLQIVRSSSEGLYTMSPVLGQLNRVNWRTGSNTAVGTSLEQKGWEVPACSPAAVDTTGKWYYTLVHRKTGWNAANKGTGGTSGSVQASNLYLIDVWMSDGMIRGTGFAIPQAFPVDVKAEKYSLIALGGWDVYIAAVVDTNLVVYSMSRLDPTNTSSMEILNINLSPFGMGFSSTYPSATLDPYNNILWYKLERGIVGFNMTDAAKTQRPEYTVTTPSKTVPFGGIAYDSRTSRVFGVVLNTKSHISQFDATVNEASLVWFASGSGPREPAVHSTNSTLPIPDRDGTALVLASDQRQVVLVSRNFSTYTSVSLGGKVLSQVESPCVHIPSGCSISSMAYEPFVFNL